METFWFGLVVLFGIFCYLGFIDWMVDRYYKNKKNRVDVIGKDMHNKDELLKNQSVSIRKRKGK